jgi:predicted ATP-grasp superfamily ATP-dependent carboligase
VEAIAQQTGTRAEAPGRYDILVLDASYKQSLACVRSLGRAGLRVALGESEAESDPSRSALAFHSRYSSRNIVLPDYAAGPSAFADAVVRFVRENPTTVVLPTGDATIAALAPYRARLAELGCVLALAPDAALEIALYKDRTLEVARKLGIDQPRTMRIDNADDLRAATAEFGFPFVLKPTSSWSEKLRDRLVPAEVVTEREAADVTRQFMDAGLGVLGQEWACGRREGVTLFIADGSVRASCGHVAYRTSPQLGGASVMRESIPVPEDIHDASIRLAMTIGMDGVCEVEFRRDARNRALLMEINPRLAGTIYNAVHAGIDLPLMIWQWATGLPVEHVAGYRTGVRTRWLHGDLRWLRDNHRRVGRPDSIPRAAGLLTFGAEFARTRRYDCFDSHDLRPVAAELRATMAAIRKSRNQPSS